MRSDAYAWPRFGAAAELQQAEARIREEAAARGYSEGKARAEAEAKRQRDALALGLKALTRQVESLGEAQARAVTELAFAVTRKLLIAELRTNPVVLETLVQEALGALDAGIEQVRVLVNPVDREPLLAALERLGGDRPDLSLDTDPSVPLGGISVSLGARSVEFDPLARLESFVEQEMTDGGADDTPGGPQRPL